MLNEVILTLTNSLGEQVTLDLYENEKLYYNYHFTDIQDFGAQSSYSREFRIPASERNVEFLGALFNVNFDGWFDFRTKVSAVLSCATLPIAIGHIQVKNVLKSAGKVSEFNIVFFGEVANLVKSVGEKKLRDISTIANGDLDYTNTYANVPNPNAETILTLCDKYNLFLTDTSNYHLPVLNPSLPLKVGHLTPAVKAYYLFDKILTDAGISWSSDTLSDILTDVYVPFINSQFLNGNNGLNDNASNLGLASNVTGINFASPNIIYNLYSALTEYQDSGSNWSGGVFTAPYNAQFTFNTWVNGTITASGGGTILTNIPYFIQYYVNDVLVANGSGNLTSSTININASNTITLQAGDIMKVKLSFAPITDYGYGDITVTLYGNGNTDFNGTGIQLVNVSASLTNDSVVMRYNAPDMKQIDFIRSIQQMYNLVFVPDKTNANVIRVEPMTTYLGSGNDLDWTQKIDLSKDINLMPTTDFQKRNISFTYQADSDVCNKLFTDSGRVYGEYKITEADFDVINDFSSGETKVELAFASTPSNAIENSNIIVPKFINDSGTFVLGKPRILFNAGSANVFVLNEGTGQAVSTSIPLLNNYSQINAEVADYDLNFAPETPLHNIVANPYNNLYNLYWRPYYHEIYDGQARIMEAFFALTVKDIFTFSYADRIWIEDSWWRVLDIEGYTVGEYEVTKVRLMRILDINNNCNIKPITSNKDGSLNWQYIGGGSATATETCCKRFGYFWNSVSELCFNKPNNGVTQTPNAGKPTLNVSELNGVIAVNGNFAKPIKVITTNHLVTNTEKTIIAYDQSAPITVTLPIASTAKGEEFTIKNLSPSYPITVATFGYEKLDDTLTHELRFANDSVTVVSDGSNWSIISKEDNIGVWTIDCMDALTLTLYTPYDIKIHEKINVKNSPTVTYTVNGYSATLPINSNAGDTLVITASTASVFNLIIEER